MALSRLGSPLLYDEVTGDIVGYKDPDGSENYFATSPQGSKLLISERFLAIATDDAGTPDALFLVSRIHASGTSPHAFRDQTSFQPSVVDRAACSFDAAMTIDTPLQVDHTIGMQSRSVHNGPGKLMKQYGGGSFNINNGEVNAAYGYYCGDRFNFLAGSAYGVFNRPAIFANVINSYGFVHSPAINGAFEVTSSIGLRVEAADGTGTLQNEYGVYIKPFIKGVNKYPIYIEQQSNPSFFGCPINIAGTFAPSTDNARDVGSSTFRFANSFSRQFRPGTGAPLWTSGSGTPEGVVTAVVGSMFTRTDGGAGTTLYVKESGAGNTGWIAK